MGRVKLRRIDETPTQRGEAAPAEGDGVGNGERQQVDQDLP
jgi:hypothetical protein